MIWHFSIEFDESESDRCNNSSKVEGRVIPSSVISQSVSGDSASRASPSRPMSQFNLHLSCVMRNSSNRICQSCVEFVRESINRSRSSIIWTDDVKHGQHVRTTTKSRIVQRG